MAQFKELGNSKYKAGKYQEAADAYGKAIEAEPKEATYDGNRAAALLMLKKYDEALEDCRQAIDLDPKMVKGYVRFRIPDLQQYCLKHSFIVLLLLPQVLTHASLIIVF